MKKWTYHHTFMLVSSVTLVWILVVQILREQNIWLWIGRKTNTDIVVYSGCLIGLLIPAWLGLFLRQITASEKGKRMISVLLVIALLLIIGGHWLTYRIVLNDDYYVYTSPDGAHTIVLRVNYPLWVAECTVYEMTSAITMQQIGAFDGEVCPGEPMINWHKDGFSVYYVGQEVVCAYLED